MSKPNPSDRRLLRILRAYWRLTRPTRWLFPGRDGERPLEPTVLHAACRSARIAAGLSKHVIIRRSSAASSEPTATGQRADDHAGGQGLVGIFGLRQGQGARLSA